MTKNELVGKITNANIDFIMALLSVRFPVLNIGIVKYFARYYLGQLIEPMVNEGTLFVAFKVIDMEQVDKSQKYNEALERFRASLENGIPDEKSEIEFDRSFRDAIKLVR